MKDQPKSEDVEQKSQQKSLLQVLAPLLFLIGFLFLVFLYIKYFTPQTPEELEKENRKRIEKMHDAGQRKDAKINQLIRELGPAFERIQTDTNWKIDETHLSGEVRSTKDLNHLLSELKKVLTKKEMERVRSSVKVGSF